MFHDISPQMTGLVSNWCNTLLYGMAVIIYVICVYVLVKRREDRSRSTTWILLGTATVQFILSTAYVALGLRLLIEGFIQAVNTTGGTLLFWTNPSVPAQVSAKAIYVTNSIFGDCILVWRVYVVWGKNIYVCLLPIVLVCGTTITGYISIQKLAAITLSDLDSLFVIAKWILACWSLSIATQIISTSLIAGKIWWHARRAPVSKSQYISLIAIIVESGAIYTAATIFLLAFFDLKTQTGAILGDMTAQIATIVPTLIIIRVEFTRKGTSSLFKNNSDITLKVRSNEHSNPLSALQNPAAIAAQIEVSTFSSQDTGKEWKETV